MVECGGLENRCAGNRTEGSNPSLSATASCSVFSNVRHIDMTRRDLHEEVEFTTIMWFDNPEAVKAFVGTDHEVAHVPASARYLAVPVR